MSDQPSITPKQLFTVKPARTDYPAHWPKIMIECQDCEEMIEEAKMQGAICTPCWQKSVR